MPDSLPILVMVSTTANEATSYQVPEVEKALNFLAARRARLMVTMTSTRSGDATAVGDINTNRQALIAIPATKATRGRYEAIAISSRLATLLPRSAKTSPPWMRSTSVSFASPSSARMGPRGRSRT